MYYGNGGNWDTNLSRDISGINNLPDCLNIHNIGKPEDSQIGCWDETYTNVIILFFNLNWNTHAKHFYCGVDGNVLGLGYFGNVTVNKKPFIATIKFPFELFMSLVCADVENSVDG